MRPILDTEKALLYIDDLIIITETIEEHLLLLQQVVELFDKNNLKINIVKSIFCSGKIMYLGCEITGEGIRPRMDKIQTLINMPEPVGKKSLNRFLCAVSYYRKFIKDLARLGGPLAPLLKKSAKYVWTQEHSEAYKAIIQAMAQITYLNFPDSNKQYVLFTDASDVAVGAVLAQIEEGSEDNITYNFIHYVSRQLNETQKNWNTIEKELFAIKLACKTLDYYIKGSKVIVKTDCKGLVGLDKVNQGKLYRWKLALSMFDLDIQHLDGTKNCLAHWISRDVNNDCELEDYMIYQVSNDKVESQEETEIVTKTNTFTNAFIKEAKEEGENLPTEVKWKAGIPVHYQYNKLYVPVALREKILYLFQTSKFSGHAGMNKMVRRIKKNLWWPGLAQDVESFIQECIYCQIMKQKRLIPARNEKLSENIGLFDIVSLDEVGPRIWHDKTYYLHVLIDHYSRFILVDVFEGPITSQNAN